MNQDFVKLDHFDGTNFMRWQDKLKFLLMALKIFYVLDPELAAIPEPTEEGTDERRAERKKRQEDELICSGHILNALSDRLYPIGLSLRSLHFYSIVERDLELTRVQIQGRGGRY